MQNLKGLAEMHVDYIYYYIYFLGHINGLTNEENMENQDFTWKLMLYFQTI